MCNAHVLHSLYYYSHDFKIKFGEDMDWTVFQLLDLACVEMCSISQASHQKSQKKALPVQCIYNTMMWGMYVCTRAMSHTY